MTPFKSGVIFLVDIIVMVTIPLLMSFSHAAEGLSMTENVILSESMGFVPALLFAVLFSANADEVFRFRKVRFSTIMLTILLVILLEPLMAALNAFTMLFTENVMAEQSVEMLQDGFSKMVFSVAIIGPMAEELVFRGIIYSGLRRSGRVFAAIVLQAVMFGFMHMNFNQMFYATALGIFFGLLTEITGSILPSFFAHFLVNFTSVLELFLFPEEDLQEAVSAVSDMEELLIAFFVFAIISIFTTALAVCVVLRIAKNEPGGLPRLRNALYTRNIQIIDGQGRLLFIKKGRVLSLPAIAGLALSFIMMVVTV